MYLESNKRIKALSIALSVPWQSRNIYHMFHTTIFVLMLLNFFILTSGDLSLFQPLKATNTYLTIVDDHTRVIWIYLLKAKSDVLHVFPDFLTMVEKQYNAHVKSVRSDNA